MNALKSLFSFFSDHLCLNTTLIIFLNRFNISYFFMELFIAILAIQIALVAPQSLYNHQSSSLYNATWMSNLDNGIPIREMSIIGTHSSMSQGTWGDAFQTQSNSLTNQLMMGMRALDIRCRHYQNGLPVHDRLVYLNTDLGGVLSTVRTFLQSHPLQVVLMHIVEEYSASGNTETFEDTYVRYQNSYSDIIWVPTSQNPLLGEVRGKVVIIQDFPALKIYGLLYSTFTVLGHKQYGTNWDQYSRWMDIKSFLSASNTAGSSRLSFWTGNVGSFPYFVASGKSSPGNSAPLLATGLTTPGFSSSYPDFPRVACFIGICTIAFQGINILAYNYIVSQGFSYLGIVFTDFLGDAVLAKSVSLNTGKFTPCPTTLLTQGCTYCSSTAQCLGCNSTQNYVYIPSNYSCGAATGYYLQWATATSNQALECGSAIIGCLKCLSNIQCTECDVVANYALLANGSCGAAPGYYLDALGVPVKCLLVGCYECLSASECLVCSSANHYVVNISHLCECESAFVLDISGTACVCPSGKYLSANGTCESVPLCPANNSGCLTCTPTPSCSLCDAANHFETDSGNASICVCQIGFYFDGLSCLQCNLTLTSACLRCASDSLCLSCVTNFTLWEGTCSCQGEYYLYDANTCLKCPIGCLRCTSASSCTICDQVNNFTLVGSLCQCNSGMFLDGSECKICGAMPGCVTCNNLGCTSCDSTFGFLINTTTSMCQCNYGFFINSMIVCEQCTALGCLDCLAADNCTQCDPFFSLDAGVCIQVCGDGVLYNLPCDDGNVIDGDGCSSTCQVQTDYTCVGGTTNSSSACSYSGTLTFKIVNFLKDPNQNKVYLFASISPALKELGALDFNTVFVPNFPVQTSNTTYDASTGAISMIFTYNTSLNDRQLSVDFVPPAIPAYFFIAKSTTVLPLATYNNLALKVYSSDLYQMSDKEDYAVQAIAIFALVLFILGLLLVSKLIAVQMMLVFQLAYAGLIILQKRELLMVSLRYLRLVNGYNDIISDESHSSLPGRVSQILYRASFFSNFNIDLLLILIPLIVGLILLIVGKVKARKNWRIYSYRVLKEWAFTLLLFAQIQLGMSTSIGYEYSQSKIMALLLGGVIYIGILAQMVLFCCAGKNFGEYKSFFKKGKVHQSWYIVVCLFRIILNFVLGMAWTLQSCCFILVAIAGVWVLATIIVRPYKSNFRPITNGLLILVIFLIYMYSMMSKNSTDTTTLSSYLPIILIGVLLICLIFNLICLIVFKVQQYKEDKRLTDSEKLKEDDLSSKEIDKDYILQLKKQLKDSLVFQSSEGEQSLVPKSKDHQRQLKNQIVVEMQDFQEEQKEGDKKKALIQIE